MLSLVKITFESTNRVHFLLMKIPRQNEIAYDLDFGSFKFLARSHTCLKAYSLYEKTYIEQNEIRTK